MIVGYGKQGWVDKMLQELESACAIHLHEVVQVPSVVMQQS